MYYGITRKKYSAKQKILHSYGRNEEEEENDRDEETRAHYAEAKGNTNQFREKAFVAAPTDAMIRVGGIMKEGGKYCKCGSIFDPCAFPQTLTIIEFLS